MSETPYRYTAEMAGRIETGWQDRWEAEGTFNADNPVGALAGPGADKEKYFLLDMFPYPSGKGLHVVIPAILDAPGAVIATSTRPDNLTATLRAREKHGPVAVFDPQHLAEGIPAGMRWSPIRGCADPLTAMIRATGLASAETALGAALLCPLIPNRLAGLGLTAFGAGLLTMYFGGDQYTEDDGIRPSDAGKAIAKDAWLVGAGIALAALPKK